MWQPCQVKTITLLPPLTETAVHSPLGVVAHKKLKHSTTLEKLPPLPAGMEAPSKVAALHLLQPLPIGCHIKKGPGTLLKHLKAAFWMQKNCTDTFFLLLFADKIKITAVIWFMLCIFHALAVPCHLKGRHRLLWLIITGSSRTFKPLQVDRGVAEVAREVARHSGESSEPR